MKKTISKLRESNPAILSSTITVSTVIVLVFAKTIALVYSGSTAVLSALIDSISDVGLSIMTLLAVKWSLKPADDEHKYGHGKIEGIAALLQAAFLVGGGSFLFFEAVNRMHEPEPMQNHLFTLFLMGLSVILSGVISYVQKHGARSSGSLAAEADSLHYSADILINVGVFLVVLFDYLGFTAPWFDPLSALIVAGIMGRTALSIAEKSFAMLMDQEISGEERSKLIAIIRSHQEVLGLHDLRFIQSGTRKMISFDVELDPSMLLWSAHEVARAIEKAILIEFPASEIMIHIDPLGDTEDSRHSSAEQTAR